RGLIIKILEGKLSHPAHRTKSYKTPLRYEAIHDRVYELEGIGWKSTAAIRKVQEEFDCSEKTVRNALRHFKVQWTQTLEFVRCLGCLDARAKRVLECAMSLTLAEDKRAVGLTSEKPHNYPHDILAEARDLAAEVRALAKAKSKIEKK